MKIICLMSKSASGKSTLIKELKSMYDIHEVKSYTTRAVRTEDKNDINTHVFVDSDYWDKNKDKAIAVYHSPKGYTSWTDINSFDKDRVNIYAIDSICTNNVFYPYCKENGIDIICVYLDIDENERKRRWINREGSLEGFSEEKHLGKEHLKDIDLEDLYICSSSQTAMIALANILRGEGHEDKDN